jgi:hypothetical protein
MSGKRMKELDNIGLRHGRDPSSGLVLGIIYSLSQERPYVSPFRDKMWELHIQELLAFKKAHGNCEVPVSIKDKSNLAKWVRGIRDSNTTKRMSGKRMKELDNIGLRHGRDPSSGFVLGIIYSLSQERPYFSSLHDKIWERHIQDLLAFKEAHGHCEVPVSTKDKSNLSKWVRDIRGSRARRRMRAARMEELDDIGLRHGRDPSTGLAYGVIALTKKIKQQTQNEGSSPKQEMREHVHAPQDFQDLDNGQFDDSLDTDDSEDGFVDGQFDDSLDTDDSEDAPQDFQALDNGQVDDSLDTDDSEDGFVSSGVSDGECMAPKVDRKKCLEEDFTKTDQPPKEVLSQVRMVDLFDAGPMFKPQDLQHYNSVTLISCQQSTA